MHSRDGDADGPAGSSSGGDPNLTTPIESGELRPGPDLAGRTLSARYRVAGELGRGGMGAVYRAFDTDLEREVAVKVLTDTGDPDRRARFLREARSAAALNHPHIVAVHDVGEDTGTGFLVMELVDGPNLRAAGRLPVERTVDLGRQLCRALAHAHARGIIHRDLKPENVLIASGGAGDPQSVKLADLGVARSRDTARITGTGVILGTPAYLAPEQALGEDLDARADLYALGALLYELLTGRPPFTGDDALAVVSQHLHAPVVPPRTFREEIPAGLDALVVRLLAKDRDRRPESAEEVEKSLVRALEPGALPALAEVDHDRPAATALLEQLVRGRLVGREEELRRLRDLWRLAQGGEGRLVLLSGEPGAGKSRLARELLVQARVAGATVLQGGCYEFEATTPYLPFVEALRGWVHTAGDAALRALPADAAPILARLAPELETRLGPFPEAPVLPAQEERLRLFDHFARFLEGLAGDRGLLLFVDDLHWADHGSIALLHYVLRQLRGARLLILAAYREVELDRAHPLSAALVTWNRERSAERIALGRFDRAATGALLASLLDQEAVSDEFAGAIHHETEGNPFFIEEVVKSLIEQGQIFREGGAWQRGEIEELAIPQSIKDAVGRRLNGVRPETTEVLQTAAALGKSFSFDELAAVSAADEDALLDALDEAAAAQLVNAESGETFVFTHDKIREVLYEELNPIRRRRLHQRVGEGLETLHGNRPGTPVQELAHHFQESGDLERALRYAEAAGEEAERIFAHDEARHYFARALECAEVLDRPEDRTRIEERVGDVLDLEGNTLEAAGAYARAAEATSDPARRAALKSKMGGAYARDGDERGLGVLEEALRELDPETQVLSVARAKAMLGRYHHYRGDYPAAEALLCEAMALAEPLDDPGLLGTIYAYLAGVFQHQGRYPESSAWARRSVTLGLETGDLGAAAMGEEFLAENAIGQGHWREGLRAARADQEYGKKIGSLERIAWSRFSETHHLRYSGALAEAEAAAREGLSLAERVGEVRLGIILTSARAMVLADLGRAAEAEETALDAVARGDAIGQVMLRREPRRTRAHQLLVSGRWEEIQPVFDQLAGEAGVDGLGTLMAQPILIRARIETGRLDGVPDLIEGTRSIAARAESPLGEAQVLALEALLNSRTGSLEAAASGFERAVAAFEALEMPLELARVLVLRAALGEAEGDAAGAAGDRESARELFTQCGAAADLAALD